MVAVRRDAFTCGGEDRRGGFDDLEIKDFFFSPSPFVEKL
jgi:hypothetical protein